MDAVKHTYAERGA